MLIYTIEKLDFINIKNELSRLSYTDFGRYEVTLLKFYRDIDQINYALNCVDEALDILNESDIPFGEWYPIWEEIKSARLKNKVLSGIELYKIGKTLESTERIKSFFHKKNAPNINELCFDIIVFENITSEILKCIGKEGNIFDKASKELNEIRENIRKLKKEIESYLEDFIRRKEYSHIIQDFVITQRENRYTISIKKDHKGKIRGIVLDTSNSGETLFIEPEMIVEKNNALIEEVKKEKQEEARILRHLSSHITKNWLQIKETLKIYGKVDLILAKARYASLYNCTRPKVNVNGYWNLKKARHPDLGEKAVPIDMNLGKDFKQLIITGPNTGGKTVCLKTAGLLTLMTQGGMFIPAFDGSEISIVDTVYLDIGDEQSIEQNLSTFSGHIKRIKKILKNATERSLVLIDELGAGTDPIDGASLGIAVLEALLIKGSKVIVTTHFEQIKNFALFNDQVETASVEFDVETLTPKYRLLMGVTGKSDALLIAKHLGIDDDIIDRAKSLQSRNQYSNEEIISELNKEKSKYISLLKDAEEAELKAKKKLNEIEIKEKEINELEEKLKKGELNQTIQSIKETRDKLNLIREKIKHKDYNEDEIKEDISKIEKLNRDLLLETEKKKVKKSIININDLSIGIKVFLSNLQKEGIITDLNPIKEEITVTVGSIRIKTPISDIESIVNDNDMEVIDSFKIKYRHDMNKPEYECHIRGMRADEALKKVDEYIEAHVIHDKEKGRIVHGKGEGILRNLIHERLKEHPCVEKFNLAHPSEGGWGVTEFWIKQ